MTTALLDSVVKIIFLYVARLRFKLMSPLIAVLRLIINSTLHINWAMHTVKIYKKKLDPVVRKPVLGFPTH